MAGRPRKIESEEMIARRRSAGWRLKCYREQNCTQEQLAEQLNISVPTIRRYETGENMIPLDVAKELSALSGKPAEYWQGYSQSEIDYLSDMDDSLDAEDTDSSAYRSSIRTLTAKYNTFLSVFDADHPYKYQNIENTAEYEFDGVPNPDGQAVKKYNGPHLIASTSDFSAWGSFAKVPCTPAGWFSLITSISQKHSA